MKTLSIMHRTSVGTWSDSRSVDFEMKYCSDGSLNPKEITGQMFVDDLYLTNIHRASRLEATYGVPYILTIGENGRFIASRRGDAVSGGGDAAVSGDFY